PNLIDIRVDGKTVKAVAQMSKQGFCYVFDRLTGKPIWPIEEKPVPQSTVPGERPSPTQPSPTKPAPFDRQGVTENDVIDFTPELRKQALAVLEKYNYGPLFTPPSFQKPTIELPGIAGGASWSGAACDPETGICYVSSVTLPYVATLTKISVPNTDYYGKMTPVETMQGVPLWKPPYGRITAIDLNTGDHRWMTPAGDLAQSNPVLRQLGLRGLGRAARGHLLLTKTLLIVAQEGGTHREGGSPEEVPDFEIRDPKLSAYDKDRKGCWRGGAATQRDGSADDLHAERRAIHRRPDRGLQSTCGTYRVASALTQSGLHHLADGEHDCPMPTRRK